jgi:hypothetical protein
MTSSADLLRMLEPAVRPVSAPGAASARAGAAPLEQRSFESLLAAAAAPGSAGSAAAAPRATPLAPLAGIDHIENGSLRSLVAAPGQTPKPLSATE